MTGAELGIILAATLVVIVTLHRLLLRIDRKLRYREELDALTGSADEPIDLAQLLESMRRAKETTLVVHVLRGGRPLCGFTTKPPRDWPPNHKWTTAPHSVIEPNCETCANMLDVEATTREH